MFSEYSTGQSIIATVSSASACLSVGTKSAARSIRYPLAPKLSTYLTNPDVKADVTRPPKRRNWCQVIRPYSESFQIKTTIGVPTRSAVSIS